MLPATSITGFDALAALTPDGRRFVALVMKIRRLSTAIWRLHGGSQAA